MKNDVGKKIKAAREARGISRYELANRAGTSWRTVRNLEEGRTKRPHGETVRAIFAALSKVKPLPSVG